MIDEEDINTSNKKFMDYLAKNGYLELLKYGIQNHFKFTKHTFPFVARNGHQDVLRWLKKMAVLGIN